MSLLEVVDVCSGYGRVPVIHNLSMHVDEGELVAVLGPNGAGKSTLMKTIARAIPITSGDIRIDGSSFLEHRPSVESTLGLGYVPQEGNVFPELTVEENLKIGLWAARAHQTGYEIAFERFPVLANRLRQKAGTLSGGERQMLATACAILQQPRLLLLDEPISGLAPQTSQVLIDTIVKINHSGTTILWVVEENPKEVLVHCDRVYFIDSGIVLKEDTADNLLRDPNLKAMFLGRAARG